MANKHPVKPTHKIRVKVRDTDRSSDVGVAWDRGDGSFSLQLNIGTVLKWDDDLHISLFPLPNKGKTALDVSRELMHEDATPGHEPITPA